MLTETLSIKVSKTEKNSLRKVALERQSTPSRLLRAALQSVLAENSAAQTSLLERHQHLFDRLDQGPGDLSTNPEHLRSFGQ
jgi:predicted transcriptional regulator